MLVVIALAGVTACGSTGESSTVADDQTTPATTDAAEDAIESAPAEPATTTPVPVTERIDRAATASTPAERVDDVITVAWIGGSELELDGRSLPDAVNAREPTVDGRPVSVVADTSIAPLPADDRRSVERAAARNIDALMVPMHPSWMTWDGHEDCLGIMPPHTFYDCILDPRPGTDVEELHADVAALLQTIADTGLPAFVYVIPHSAESLANPLLANRLAATEDVYRSLDPGLDRIEYVPSIVNRSLPPMREGVEFLDMVHPTDAGIELLADFFTSEIERFFTGRMSN